MRERIALGHAGCEVAIYFEPNDIENGDEYEDLPITPKNGNPFEWEEETIQALHGELEKSEELIFALVEELEDLRSQGRKQVINIMVIRSRHLSRKMSYFWKESGGSHVRTCSSVVMRKRL